MGLAVKKFFHTLPQLPFRFVVDFAKGDGKLPDKLKYAVRSVKFTDAEGNTSEGAIYYGNGSFTIPVWDITARSLSITFEETDDMFVTKFADDIAALSFNSTPLRLAVVVREYDNMMYKVLKGRCYWVELLDYDEPQFARTGGPSVVSITMNFIVKAISEDYAVSDDELKRILNKTNMQLSQFNAPREDEIGGKYQKLLKSAEDTHFDSTINLKALEEYEFEKGDGSSSGDKFRYRDDSAKYQTLQKNMAAIKEKSAQTGASELALAGANNASGKGNVGDATITNEEMLQARKLDKQLQSTATGRALVTTFARNDTKAYQLGGGHGRAGDPGMDCSAFVGEVLKDAGFDINVASAYAGSGSLEQQIKANGVKEKDVGGLKPGDVVVSRKTKGSQYGHTMVYVGTDDKGEMIFADASGQRGVSTTKMSKAALLENGYTGYDTSSGPRA